MPIRSSAQYLTNARRCIVALSGTGAPARCVHTDGTVVTCPPSRSMHRRQILARYLRGGRWVPVRVGALSLKGAALSPERYRASRSRRPRADHSASIARSSAARWQSSTVRESNTTGASTFSIALISTNRRKQLTALLMAARERDHDQAAAGTRDAAFPSSGGHARHAGARSKRCARRLDGRHVRASALRAELGATIEFSDDARRQ